MWRPVRGEVRQLVVSEQAPHCRFGTRLGTALDAGCGPGGSALRLAAAFQQVEAYDYSGGFVELLADQVGVNLHVLCMEFSDES